MKEEVEREKLKEKGAKQFVEKMAEKRDWSEEEKEIFKLGVYCGLKFSIELDVFEIGMKALQKEYEEVDSE